MNNKRDKIIRWGNKRTMNDPDKEALFMILDRVGQRNVRRWIERYEESTAYDDPFEFYMREDPDGQATHNQ